MLLVSMAQGCAMMAPTSTVDFCELVKNPAKFNHKAVRFSAIAFPDHTYDIHLTSDACSNIAIIVCLTDEVRSSGAADQLIHAVFGRYPYEVDFVDVSLVGVFHDRSAPFAPMAVCLSDTYEMKKREPLWKGP